jgi:four helix bundle protein
MHETAKRRNGETARRPIRHFRHLEVYQNALNAGLRVYELSKSFPPEEKYSLTDQIRRSSRSVCANLAKAWRKRRYEAAFIAKLSDAEGEAAETQVHLESAFQHRYVSRDAFLTSDDAYEKICAQTIRMIDEPEKWLIRRLKGK